MYTHGAVQRDDKDIAMLTRSMLEILSEASAGVEIPSADIKEGRATKMEVPESLPAVAAGFKVQVRSSSEKPSADQAFVAVRYRDKWFWVDDRDLPAKRGLGFLMVLFTLIESGATAEPPVLTISKP